ncbi:MAG: GreA/GreB family elongation factor [Candidatus Yanofskybacteria bacterium]|nr:GreA/GreB family elongation factor [Candidatus Yanofskybacteria bacterium]
MEQKYILTKEGFKRFQSEYERLLELRKFKVQGEDTPLTWHSEEVEPEYLAYWEDMELLEKKIAEHEHILRNVEEITMPRKSERHIVAVGATVTIDFGGEIDEFTIVGTLEADPVQKKISDESPIGQCLIGAKVGDQVRPSTSMANRCCKILKVRYEVR